MNQTETPAKRVQIGLSGWGDHDDIFEKGTKSGEKLHEYSRRFPVVEIDSSFYGVPSPERMEKWSSQTPESFGFIVKAYQGMTGHARGKIPYPDTRTMFHSFRESVEVLLKEGKLRAVLFQYPPWFDCERRNVEILRRTREWMDGLPLALEFRHQSWFAGDMKEKTLAFMKEEGWIHSICDEPQAGDGSVPTILRPTRDDAVLIRMHGRNIAGWQSTGQPNWREVRYLYRYNEEELGQWKEQISELLQEVREGWVIFNNNSGGDAAANAIQLMGMLGIETPPLPPGQMSLFDEDRL